MNINVIVQFFSKQRLQSFLNVLDEFTTYRNHQPDKEVVLLIVNLAISSAVVSHDYGPALACFVFVNFLE